MRIALIGLAGSGKTTVFNAVADQPVQVPPGGVQNETHVQVVRVQDPRLDRCREIFQPKKFTRAGLELWDPPGIPTGSTEHDKEQRTRILAALREADAYVVVVRGFRTDRYPYERSEADPRADLKRVAEELSTADFVVVESRMAKLEQNLQRNARSAEEDRRELDVLRKVVGRLEEGRDIHALELDPSEQKQIRGFQLFSGKPLVLLYNGPDEAPAGLAEEIPLGVRGQLAMDAQIEAELHAMDPEERPTFMEEFGIGEPAADRFVHEIYRGVGLCSFFTVGEDEVRAWTIPQGATAVEAAGKIHTDLARGFIRAEVFSFDDLDEAGGMRELKARGKLRLEAKDYRVKDGEIVHIRSGV